MAPDVSPLSPLTGFDFAPAIYLATLAVALIWLLVIELIDRDNGGRREAHAASDG